MKSLFDPEIVLPLFFPSFFAWLFITPRYFWCSQLPWLQGCPLAPWGSNQVLVLFGENKLIRLQPGTKCWGVEMAMAPVDLKTNGDIKMAIEIWISMAILMDMIINMEVKRNMFWGFNGISWGFTWFDHQNVGYEWGDVNGGIVEYIANLIWYFGVSKTWVIPQSGHLNFESDDNYTLWS